MRENWPIISNLNPPPGHIINRAGPLAQLEEHFKTNSTTVISHKISPINDQHQVISGLGGIGKTQLARSYAWWHQHEYKVIWWCGAENKTVLLQDLRALITKLNSQHDPNSDDYDPAVEKILVRKILLDGLPEGVVLEKIEALFKKLDNVLLIIDNVEEENVVVDVLPVARPSKSHALITSRNRHFEKFGRCVVSLGVFEESEALVLLLNYVKKSGESFSAEEEIAARELGRELGYLALALNQAGAFMRRMGIGLRDYLKIFREKFEELSKLEKHPEDYPETVHATWVLNLSAIRSKKGIDRGLIEDFLGYISYLSPDAISREFLKRLLNVDDLILGRVLKVCGKYSLVDFQPLNPNISVHRLVQRVIRLSHDVSKSCACLKSICEHMHDILTVSNIASYIADLENILMCAESLAIKEGNEIDDVKFCCFYWMGKLNHDPLWRLNLSKQYLTSAYLLAEKTNEKNLFLALSALIVLCGDMQDLDEEKRYLELFRNYNGKRDVFAFIDLLLSLAHRCGLHNDMNGMKEYLDEAEDLAVYECGDQGFRRFLVLEAKLAFYIKGEDSENISVCEQKVFFFDCFAYSIPLLHYYFSKRDYEKVICFIDKGLSSFNFGLKNDLYGFCVFEKDYFDGFVSRFLGVASVIVIRRDMFLRCLKVLCCFRLKQIDVAARVVVELGVLIESTKKIAMAPTTVCEEMLDYLRVLLEEKPVFKISFAPLKSRAAKISSSTVKQRMTRFLEDAETKFSTSAELSLAQVEELQDMVNQVRDDLGGKLSKSKTGQAILKEIESSLVENVEKPEKTVAASSSSVLVSNIQSAESLDKTQKQSARYRRWEMLKELGEYARKERRLADNSICCFISYAWGSKEDKSWVKHFADDLVAAGIVVLFDQNSGDDGDELGELIESQIQSADFILVVGTPAYLLRLENQASTGRSPVIEVENSLIRGIASIGKEGRSKVIPLLLKGTAETSLPSWLRMLNKLHVDFVDPSKYHQKLFGLLSAMYGLLKQDPQAKQILKTHDKMIRQSVDRGVYSAKKTELRKTSGINAQRYGLWREEGSNVFLQSVGSAPRPK